MSESLADYLELPEACHLGKRVFKKLFHEHAPLQAADARALQGDVDTIVWQHTLKPTTIAIPAFEDDEREYLEIAVLEGRLHNTKHATRLAELVHRAIPYPVLLILTHERSSAMSLAHKRYSRAEKGAIVADPPVTSHWIAADRISDIDRQFVDSLAIAGLPQTHLLATYTAWMDRVLAIACAQRTGIYRLSDSLDTVPIRVEALTGCRRLEVEIAELRTRIRRETQFNRQVELNSTLKNLERKLHDLTKTL